MNKFLAIGVGLLISAFANVSLAEGYEKIIGVGIALEQKSEKAFVVKELVTNSPAARIGKIQVGDMITEIKSLPTTAWERVYGKKLEDVVAAIRGPLGVPVELKVYRPGDHGITEVVLVREELDMPSTDALTDGI